MLNYNIDTDVNETIFDDLKEYQEITDENQIIESIGDVVILNRFKHNMDTLLEKVVDTAVLCWGNKNKHDDVLQHTLIKFVIQYDDKVIRTLPLNRFMISLVFIKPVIDYIEDINIDDYLLHDFLSKKTRVKIQNKIAETLTSYGKTINEIKKILAQMSLDLKQLLLIFSEANMQIFTAGNMFLDHYMDSELIRDINNTEYSSDMQTSDIIEANAEKYKLLEAEMIRRKNPFFIDNKYTNLIKPKQIEELYINFSQIPDGKDIVPVIMNGNGFRAGYASMPVMYAGGIAARVPDLMNERYMGSAGYFARNMWMLTYGTLSKTIWDCGSVNKIPVVIDEMELEMKDGRYYSESEESSILKILDKSDKHLIGRTLWFRSPCTCNLNEDCCHVCYGTKALKVSELEGGFIYTTQLITKDVSQKILSAKHLLKTDAEKIEFSNGYDKYFIVENSTIVPKSDKKFDIYFRDDYDENISNELTIYVDKTLFPIKISNYMSMYIPDKIFDNCKDIEIDDVTYHKISSSKVLELDDFLCDIIPINKMMTARYMKIMNLFETDIAKGYASISDAVRALTDMVYGLLPVLSVHGEIILGHLIRSVENPLLRPNWLEKNPAYKFMTLKNALTNHESATMALAFEKTRHHLLHKIFDQRNEIHRVGASSFEDYFFGYKG